MVVARRVFESVSGPQSVLHQIAAFPARQQALDPLADRLQEAIDAAYTKVGPRARALRDVLHGTWLGHPLHPVLTDVPLGCWTAALLFDVTPGMRRAANASIFLGVASVPVTAAAGATDWRHTDGAARRIGLAHGLLNVVATLLYTLSLVLRLFGRSGRRTAFAGFASAVVAAYLGGTLVYQHRIGTRHGVQEPVPDEFTAVLPLDELPAGEARRMLVAGQQVMLARVGDNVYALTDICTHLGCSLSVGRLQDTSIVCLCHGSRFDLRDGRVLNGPAVFPETVLDVRIRDGQIEVRRSSVEGSST